MSDAEHAPLACSSAPVWSECPGSKMLQAVYPDTSSGAAEEGTAAHWVASEVLESYKQDGPILLLSELVGEAAPNGVMITDDMVDAVRVYIKDVLRLCTLSQLDIEQRLEPCSMLHPDVWGTADATLWDATQNKLTVWDYKHGRKRVDAYYNRQLMCYAILKMCQLHGDIWPAGATVEMRIVQPRVSSEASVFMLTGDELRVEASLLSAAAHEAASPSPMTKAGSHCYYCKARASCTTLMRTSDVAGTLADTAQWRDLTPGELGQELRLIEPILELLQRRVDALHEQAMSYLDDGEIVPGKQLTRTRSITRWKVQPAEVVEMGDLLGVDLRSASKSVTPRQAGKLGLDEAVINAYTETSLGKIKLGDIKKCQNQ